MKIVIDARMYGLEHAGIGRYILNLVNKIEKQDKRNDYYLFLRKKYYQELVFSNPRFKKVLADFPHYSLLEQVLLPIKLAKVKPDFVHFPHFNIPIFYNGRFIVTIHDLIKHFSKGLSTTTRSPWLYWLKFLGYKFVFNHAVKKACQIIVPSKAVKNQLIKTYQVEEKKVIPIYEGAEEKFQIGEVSAEKRGEILAKYKVKKPFVIYVGSVYPHKNIEALLYSIKVINSGLFNKLNRIDLVVSCARSVFWEKLRRKAEEIGVGKHVNLAGFIPDEELAALFQDALAFVFPTLSEGFGLPGLEAMAAGLPVLCSDIPVLREVYGEAALFFNPKNSEDVAEKILRVASSKKLRAKLIKKGKLQTQKYSWEKMVRQTLKVYERGGEVRPAARSDLQKSLAVGKSFVTSSHSK